MALIRCGGSLPLKYLGTNYSSFTFPAWDASAPDVRLPIISYNQNRAAVNNNVYTIKVGGTYKVSYIVNGGQPGSQSGRFKINLNVNGENIEILNTGNYGYGKAWSGSTTVTLNVNDVVYCVAVEGRNDYNVSTKNGTACLVIEKE